MDKYVKVKDISDAISRMLNLYIDNMHIACGLEMAKSAIDEIPQIEAELVKEGNWIEEWTPVGDGEHRIYTCSCSVCNWDEGCKRYFCPNCGAKMKDVSETVIGV